MKLTGRPQDRRAISMKFISSSVIALAFTFLGYAVYGDDRETESTEYQKAMRGLAEKEIRPDLPFDKMLDLCIPTWKRTLGRFTAYHFELIPGYHGLTIIAKNGLLKSATEWSCTYTCTYFDKLTVEDEKEYRTLINRQLSANVDAVMQRALHGQISKYLLEHTELEVPAGLSQRQMDWVIRRRMAEVYERGLTAEEIDKDSDRLRTEARDQAILDLKIFFIMERIAEDLKVEVPDEELNGAIAQIAARRGQRFDRTRDELARENGLEGLYLQLRDAKILDALLEKAEITEVEGPPAKEAPKKAKASPGKRTAAKKKPKDDSADET